jgi:hypothetical protein
MNVALLTIVALTGVMFFSPERDTAGQSSKAAPPRSSQTKSASAEQAKLTALRMRLIDRKKAVREQLLKSMSFKEDLMRLQSAEHEKKKDLYEKNLISQDNFENSEILLASTRQDIDRLREWISEDNHALALADEGGFGEEVAAGAALIRYDGAMNWSLARLETIRVFFRERFGRPLPISAMGQSDTHDRLNLDHRDAVDVALRPDSVEGRGLMAYLRRSGIPFTAFRGKLSSMSTGAHIHIGHPSPRLTQVKQQIEPASRRDAVQHG